MSKEFQIRDGNLIASFDLENEDGDIDFCKLLKVSHGVANEIGMFVDYIATNKIIGDQSKEIADLEAKLAECEKSKESYRLQNEQHHLQLLQFYSRLGVEAFGADIHEKALETLMIMKEQLAEKDKEISEYIKIVDDLHKQLSDKCDFCDKTKDQDKISFAVEQFEQLKKLCQEKFDWWENSEWEGNIYDKSDVSNAYFDIEANVDNQIEELKKEMK